VAGGLPAQADHIHTLGVAGLTAYVMTDNVAMLELMRGAGYAVETRLEDGAYLLTLKF
jgi:hypothetical protein